MRRSSQVNLDRCQAAGRAHDLRHQGAVVARAATDVNRPLSGRKVERVDERGHQTRLTIVQEPLWINDDKDILVELTGIRYFARAAWDAKDGPGSRTQEILAGHACQRVDERGRAEIRAASQVLRIATANRSEIGHRRVA